MAQQQLQPPLDVAEHGAQGNDAGLQIAALAGQINDMRQELTRDIAALNQQVTQLGEQMTEISQRVAIMEATNQVNNRILVMTYNRGLQQGEPLMWFNNAAGVIPAIAPVGATANELYDMDANIIGDLLAAYGQPTDGSARDKKQRMLKYMGVRRIYF